MKRALLIAPPLDHPGGGSCVAAWAVQALYRRYRLSVLCWEPCRVEAMNARFGTTVDPAAVDLRVVPGPWRALLARLPLPLALLRSALLHRHARALGRRGGFHLVAGVVNEMDVGRPALQYIHFPWAAEPRPQHDLRWYHWRPLLFLYRRLATGASGTSPRRIRDNRTLANSAWTGRHYGHWYRGPWEVLYPPAPVPRRGLPWAAREDAVACVGRFSPEKRLLEVIDIVAAVRRRGYPLTLHLCGTHDNPAYLRQVTAAARAHGDWVKLHLELPREALIELLGRCRYGLHGMREEHFGIAVAELVRLGCLTFAHREGGPAEILDHPQLLFGDDGEAVGRITAVLEDPARAAALGEHLRRRGEQFSPEAFMAGFAAACAACEEGDGGGPA